MKVKHKVISFKNQIKSNSVAIISLIIALGSLSYNTWRNEKTEENRNRRVAAFEIILKLNELQQLIFHHHYDGDVVDKGNPRTGWTYVLTIEDLSAVLSEDEKLSAAVLKQAWQSNWSWLKNDDNMDSVLKEIDLMRIQIQSLLSSLE